MLFLLHAWTEGGQAVLEVTQAKDDHTYAKEAAHDDGPGEGATFATAVTASVDAGETSS